jgi:hypothetical protein
MRLISPKPALCLALLLALAACGESGPSTVANQPIREHGAIHNDAERGTLTGEGGWVIFGGKSKSDDSGANIGVNGFVWRATLDTLSFMPFASADPFGGVVLTDWYEDPKTPGTRYKVNAFILSRTLRADAVKIKLFKQTKTASGWRDEAVNPQMERDLEDTILTRARQLRVAELETSK